MIFLGAFFIAVASLFIIWNSVLFCKTLLDLRFKDRLGDRAEIFMIKEDMLVGEISVGTSNEGQHHRLKVAFTLATGNTWLRSVDLCENKDCSGKPFAAFDGRKSKTYVKKDTRPFKGKYMSSEVRGFIAEDTIKFGNVKKGVAVEKQEFGEINSISGNLDGIDGILGLGLMSDSEYHEALVWKLAEQARVEPVFGIYFFTTFNMPENTGMVVFGGKDTQLALYDFNHHDVVMNKDNKYTGWIISVDKAIVQYPGKDQHDFQLSVDTATLAPTQDEISLPENDFQKMLVKIFAKVDIPHDGTSFKCKKDWQYQLPDLIVVARRIKYSLTPQQYVIRDGENCKVAISSAGDSRTVLLGRVFMRKFYTRFHIGTKQVQISQTSAIH